MKLIRQLAAAAMFTAVVIPVSAPAQNDVDALRKQFNGIIEDLNDNSFELFNRAISKKDMTARIYGASVIEPEVKSAFSKEFSSSIQGLFTASFPKSKKEILGTIVEFRFKGNEGRAVVRYASSGYRYSYHVYELGLDSKGRIQIADWVDYYRSSRFSEKVAQDLAMAMPGKQATRNLLRRQSYNEGQIFQVGELFKAVRDNQPERFFQIFDGLDKVLLKEPLLLRINLQFAMAFPQSPRAGNAVSLLVESFPNEALYSLQMTEYYIQTGQFQEAIEALTTLEAGLGIRDGAIGSLKSSAALAMGRTEDAVAYALQATVAEPTLQVSWWSLLRARTRAEDYSGATEALARLEDDFGHSMDPATLRRDRFLRVLASNPVYQDWRASRQ
jgi:tetratricopeptide (TPR) repeat protein